MLMGTFIMIASCITIFSCSVTHKQLIFILCHFQSLVLIFQCKSEANSLMWRGNTLNSSNTCLARCNWLNHSWAQSLLCHRKQRESTLRNLNQPHQQSRWKPESVEWEKLSHSCQPPPPGRQWDGNVATVYGSRNKLLFRFLELFT